MSKVLAAAKRLAACTAVLAAAIAPAGAAAPTPAPPDFSQGGTIGWTIAPGSNFIPVPGSPKPVDTDPRFPYINNATAQRTGQQSNFHISDLNNAPNLKQWVKDVMKKGNDEVIGGKIGFMPGASCVPWGTPFYTLSNGPQFFIQTPAEVIMVDEDEAMARHIYMNVPHSAHPKPSWYGESVGHYEGDTLVVDTIGQSTKTFVDHFRTPHTEAMHVVERWRMIDGGKQIEVLITIDDPYTFNQPWQAIRRLNRVKEDYSEVICREGNFMLIDYGIPIDNTPDF